MIFEADDLWEDHDGMEFLQVLKEVNPAFRMTAFCVQGLGSDAYWESLPDWIECATHGEFHADSSEATDWSYEKSMEVLLAAPPRLRGGHKSPGWQISDGMYRACLELDWWVADQHYNDHRRPRGLRCHYAGENNHTYVHIQNVCGNGLEQMFPRLLRRVIRATHFEVMSEVVQPWLPDRQIEE